MQNTCNPQVAVATQTVDSTVHLRALRALGHVAGDVLTGDWSTDDLVEVIVSLADSVSPDGDMSVPPSAQRRLHGSLLGIVKMLDDDSDFDDDPEALDELGHMVFEEINSLCTGVLADLRTENPAHPFLWDGSFTRFGWG